MVFTTGMGLWGASGVKYAAAVGLDALVAYVAFVATILAVLLIGIFVHHSSTWKIRLAAVIIFILVIFTSAGIAVTFITFPGR